MTYLPDVNVWISLAASGHPHHQIAGKWFEGCSDAVVFCRVTEVALFLAAANAKVMGEEVLDARPTDFERSWRHTAIRGKIGPNLWTDGYLKVFGKRWIAH